ncbi:MAG TPA: T9SS type A sorting domain-containing protein [Candidatus Eisenbacteria bacterium]|nr:T9SS type A sorting domain-containing protein [Candidatus Eisenbacteria bacterium]
MNARLQSAALAAALLLAFPAARPAAGAALLGLVDTGELFRSTDGGVMWTAHAVLPVRDAVALAARLSSSDLFLASRSGSIYRSTDAGATWIPVGAIAASGLVDLSIRPDGGLLALTATGSLYLSTDLGASFAPLASLGASNFASLAFTTPAVTYYALTRTGEVYESVDGGTSWAAKGLFTASNAVRLRAIQSALYALTETGDVYRSTDGAASWAPISTLSQVGMSGLARNGLSLVAASREGHVATSLDGVAWAWQGSMNQLTLTALATDEPATTGVTPRTGGGVFLGAPYPNPSRGSASFELWLDRAADVALTLYDVSGRRLASLAPRRFEAGIHRLSWDPGVSRAGLYFLSVERGGKPAVTRRWVVAR